MISRYEFNQLFKKNKYKLIQIQEKKFWINSTKNPTKKAPSQVASSTRKTPPILNKKSMSIISKNFLMKDLFFLFNSILHELIRLSKFNLKSFFYVRI